MEYLKENAKTFEDYRIGAAAVEAYGVKESGVDVKEWVAAADVEAKKEDVMNARMLGSRVALAMRLGTPTEKDQRAMTATLLRNGQLTDGGWGKPGAKASEADTTYRVMRAYMLMEQKPKDADNVAKFVASCRRKDGGYGVDAEAPSSMSGVYYAAKIGEWLK